MKAKDKLRAYWSKKENDLILYHPLGLYTKSDARWLSDLLSREILEELEKLGYDSTTIKFEICPQKGNARFASERI